ncbi:MAG: type I 3-dehydroquinate dehydratase, partial [Spirochaetales bacterium]|nr:type I 3-dehydroquinate dehydratase [Spirochaetales bacterium]
MTGPGSRICLSLTAATLDEDLRLIASRRRYVDLVELRADLLDPAELPLLARFPRRAGLPVILAIRRLRDGGRWKAREAERRRLFARSLPGGFAYVELEEDVEDPAAAEAVRSSGGRVIRCLHELSGVPERPAERLRALPRGPGEIPMLAVTPKGCGDLPAFVDACRQLRGEEKILIAGGQFGLFSLILAARLGSLLTFCSVAGSGEPDAGQPDPRALVELYRFREQDRDTFVCGVIGNPIAHSRSPEFHNRGYQALGLNGVYLPFLVDEPGAFFRLAGMLDLRGFSVTIPHKQAVLPHLSERDGSVERVGACNTVVRRAGGWFGTNTDVRGFLAPLESGMPELLVRDTRATVIGAGGGARSVVYALRSLGIRPLIVNRTAAKAEELAEFFGCSWAGLDRAGIERIRENSDLIVQATSVGMEPEAGRDALPGYRFSGAEVVYDLVY